LRKQNFDDDNYNPAPPELNEEERYNRKRKTAFASPNNPFANNDIWVKGVTFKNGFIPKADPLRQKKRHATTLNGRTVKHGKRKKTEKAGKEEFDFNTRLRDRVAPELTYGKNVEPPPDDEKAVENK
jgi:hypothetical protein